MDLLVHVCSCSMNFDDCRLLSMIRLLVRNKTWRCLDHEHLDHHPTPEPRRESGSPVPHVPRIALGALIAILCVGGYLARFGLSSWWLVVQHVFLDIGGGSNEVPSRALTYNISQGTFEDDFIEFPFPMVGYISSL